MTMELKTIDIHEWTGKGEGPVLISGPCSAETPEQVEATVEQLAATGKVNVLRAGIWKPRTRPNSFEGVGEPALQWLVDAGRKYNMPVATEVANVQHVDAALKAGVDILWIGARTTVNPFSVQEIADAVKGMDIPIMVKNPVNPDLQLWIGALERMSNAGITKLAAIHRGFSSFEKTPFRNAPMWEIPIELKRLYPQLDILCDPSHIAGNRDLVPLVAQKALDLDMSGLMIESHITPDKAWSDAAQQVTPAGLNKLISELVVRQASISSSEFRDILEKLREEIDGIDDDIIQLLASRMDIAEKIGEYKRDNQVTILQVNRWEQIISERSRQGQAMGLSEGFVRELLQLIHKESIRRQTQVMNKKPIS